MTHHDRFPLYTKAILSVLWYPSSRGWRQVYFATDCVAINTLHSTLAEVPTSTALAQELGEPLRKVVPV